MKNVIVNVSRETSYVDLNKSVIGVDGENLQGNLVFMFTDEFVNGQARLEYDMDEDKNYIMLEKDGESYTLPIKNVLTKKGSIKMQLVITQGIEEDSIPVFKSNQFYLWCEESINAVTEAPEGYKLWIERANVKLNQIDKALEEVANLDIDAEKVEDTATVTITKKDGTQKSVEIKDGEKGEKGEPNTLSIGTVEKGDEADATITGEAPNQILNLVLPKGDKGDTGEKGEQGNPGKDGIDGKPGKDGINGIDGFSPNAKVEQTTDGAKITITDKTGTTTANIKNGIDGEEYDDTQIWEAVGQNSRDIVNLGNRIDHKQDTLVSGTNIKTINNQSILGSGNIHIEGGGTGTSDYNELSNKPKINNVELSGNKTLDNLGIQPKITTSNKLPYNVISGTPTIPTKTSELTNDSNFTDTTDLEEVVNDLEGEITSKTTVTMDDVNYTVQQIVDKIYTDKQNTLSDQDKYALVKFALVNNTIELTDEEKLKIETWLGLSENYLTYYNETPYTVDSDYIPTHKKYVDTETKKLDDKIKEIELFKFPNMTIIGTPTINNGQVSNFTMNDYLEFPFLVDFRNRPFEINFAFTTGSNVSTQQNILDSNFGLAMAIKNARMIMAISYNGTSWSSQYTGNLVIEPNTTYVYKITWNGMLYRVQYYNGSQYVDDFYFASTQQPYPKQMFIGVSKLSDNYFEGSINLNYANLKIDGNIIWQGMDDAGLSTRADVNFENITEIAEQRIKRVSAIEVIENANETELQPNKYYKWGEVDNLNLTLGTPIDGILNEYAFEFISGATATTLTLPDTVKWETIPNIEENKKYQISIVNNIALIVGV